MKLKQGHLAIFILPAMILYTIFIIYPLISSLFLSLYSWSGVGEKIFIGFKNFQEIFNGFFRKEFFNALFHNLYFFIVVTTLELGLGFFIALMLATKIKGSRVFKVVTYIPNAIPIVLVGFMWGLFLNPQVGLINQTFRALGLDSLAQPWLGDPNLALSTIMLVNVWRNLGFYVLVLFAAILNVSPDLIDAAYIDGANNWKVIWHIIFPLTFSTIRTLIILLFIWSFNTFDIIYSLIGVQAGPIRSTDVLGTLFYRTAFGGLGSSATDMGLGAAVTVCIFSIVMPVSVLYVYLIEKKKRSI